ncbi:MAG TPA: hypothetical protein VK579_04275 [Terriglobales bacterium]|nr:hypothetical protein [Terriglobales bacterium]
MAYAPGPDPVSVARIKVNFDRLVWHTTAIIETTTKLATSGDRQHSSSARAIENDDELPPGFVSVYVVKMLRACRKPVDAVRLGITPEQTAHDAQRY